jgi:ADP-heptose:LPS heptosyltransferase
MAAKKVDLVMDFQGLLRSALIGRLCRGGEIAGLSDAREGARFFYDRVADVSGAAHAVDRYLRLATEVGAELPPELDWQLPEGSAPAGFTVTGEFVLLHPFSRGKGKSLTVSQVQDFCAAMSPVRVIVAGRADEQIEPAGNITDLLNRTTLSELIWLIRRAAFVVSVDSGPMHIAAAITRSLVSIHTWSDPAKVGPYRPEAWVWKSGAMFQIRDLADPGTYREYTDIGKVGGWVKVHLGKG